MSAGIIPDVYRHTARKSTVSKTIKSTSICSPQNLNLSHLNISFDDKQLQTSNSINRISTSIKLEELPRETFIIQRDNEVEQMIIDDHHELIIRQILDEMIESLGTIVIHHNDQSSSQNQSMTIIRDQDVNQLMSTMLNTIYPNDSMRRKNSISSPSNKPLADIEPIETERKFLTKDQCSAGNKNNNQEKESSALSSPQSCSCQCHSSTNDLNDDFIEFEQALRQIRTEQEHERSLNNNPLIQTLKRQHEELMNFYEKNKKASRMMSVARVDRAQQTIKFNSYDSQIQTDLPTSVPSSRSSVLQKPTIVSTTPTPIQTMNNNATVSATRIHPFFQPSNSTPALRPRPPANTSNGTSSSDPSLPPTTRKSVPIPSNVTNGHSPTTTTIPSRLHDVVDLTEEDEDDTSTRSSTSTSVASRQSTSSASTHSSSTTTTATTTTSTSSRSNSRSSHPIGASLSAQSFPLRPLPEHNPCDLSIARPQLSITQENASVRLTWNLVSTPMESIQNYEIYAYKQNATVTNSDWKKIGTVKSMRLPMAVTLKEFQANSHYAFAVRAVSIHNQIGPFCEPKTIFTGNNPVQPLHTSQLLNVST